MGHSTDRTIVWDGHEAVIPLVLVDGVAVYEEAVWLIAEARQPFGSPDPSFRLHLR
jgi:hypothetical protein